MQVVTQVWRREFETPASATTTMNTTMNTTLNVLLTSESRNVFREQKEFLQNTALRDATSPFAFRIITNSEGDAHPIKDNWRDHSPLLLNFTADQNMIAALSSLQIQLLAKYTIGNCCSNFHQLLFDFLKAGCGKVSAATTTTTTIISGQGAECLQSNENPELRLCCGRIELPHCKEIRMARQSSSSSTFTKSKNHH
jgi:hypothetical protein